MNQQTLLALPALLVLVTAAGHAQVPPSATAPVQKKMELKKVKLGQVRNVHALGDVYLAGQPTREDLSLLQSKGFKTIITVRKASEVPWDEAAEAKKLGLKYVEAPFQGADQLQSEVFDKVRKALNDKKRGPTLFHCGSANRVGAVWYAHRVLDGKLSHDAAYAEAIEVGLRTPAYMEQAQAYVEKVQAAARLRKD